MTDEAALRAAVQQSPHDWTPRLVLADYLDDTGEPHHAEEAAHIRMAHDPGTPLGLVVAASRRAWRVSHAASTRSDHVERVSRRQQWAEEYLHGVIHAPQPYARELAVRGLILVHDAALRSHSHTTHHADTPDDQREKHRTAGAAHYEAVAPLAEYARTL